MHIKIFTQLVIQECQVKIDETRRYFKKVSNRPHDHNILRRKYLICNKKLNKLSLFPKSSN